MVGTIIVYVRSADILAVSTVGTSVLHRRLSPVGSAVSSVSIQLQCLHHLYSSTWH